MRVTVIRKYAGCALLVALFAALAAAAALCPPRLSARGDAAFADETTYRTEYGVGYTLTVYPETAEIDGTTVPAGAVVQYENADVIAQMPAGGSAMKVRLDEPGMYQLIYTAEYEGRIYPRVHSFEVKDMPFIQHSVRSRYVPGEPVDFAAYAMYGGERAEAAFSVSGAGGPVAADGDALRLPAGDYTVTFTGSVAGRDVSETHAFRVARESYADLLYASAGEATFRADADAPAILRPDNGVEVLFRTPGSAVRYANPIDVGAFDTGTNLIRFGLLTGDGYASLSEIFVRLIDVCDETNVVEYRIYNADWAGNLTSSYCSLNYDGRTIGRFNEAGASLGEVRPDWQAQLASTFFDASANNATEGQGNWVELQTDYKERAFYVTSYMSSVQDPWQLLDCDDPSQVGQGKEWEGFTTGEVWLEIAADGMGRSGIIINEVAGQKLSGAHFSDDTPPVIRLSGTDVLPDGVQGKPYPLPEVLSVTDSIDGELPADAVSVTIEYNDGGTWTTLGPLQTDFVPERAGAYRIVYSATDTAGNEGELVATFTVIPDGDIVVRCDLRPGKVGSEYILPDVTAEGMATVVSKTVTYTYAGEELSLKPGDALFLDKAGELRVTYDIRDYAGNRVADSVAADVAADPLPVIDIKGFPSYAYTGHDLVLPDFTAVDYNYGESDPDRYPVRTIRVNGTPVDLEKRVYTVNEPAGSVLHVQYAAGRATVSKTLPVVQLTYLSDYFVTDSAAEVVALNNESYTGFRFTEDTSVALRNAVALTASDGLTMDFRLVGARSAVLDIVMTDYYDADKSVTITIDAAHSSLAFCGNTYALDATGNIYLVYQNFGKRLSGYGTISRYDDGSAFDGFEGSLIWLTFRCENVAGETELRFNSIAGRAFVTNYRDGFPRPLIDNATPFVVFDDAIMSTSYTEGDIIRLGASSAWSLLSGERYMTVKLLDPDRNEVMSEMAANNDRYFPLDRAGTWAAIYTIYRGSVEMASFPLRIVVSPRQERQILLNGEIQSEYASGSTLVIPDAEYDRESETLDICLLSPSGKSVYVTPGSSFVPDESGSWRIVYILQSGNDMLSREFRFTVK